MLIYETTDEEIRFFFFEFLPDGLHPGFLLAQKWFRRLELDIVRDCYVQKIPWKMTRRNPCHFNRMSDSKEHDNNVRKENEEAVVSGESAGKADDSSWLHKTLESFSYSFDEQQRMQREVFMQTMQEMGDIKKWPDNKLNFSSFLRLQKNNLSNQFVSINTLLHASMYIECITWCS